MSDEKTNDGIVDAAESDAADNQVNAVEAVTDAAEKQEAAAEQAQPQGKRRRQGASRPAPEVVEEDTTEEKTGFFPRLGAGIKNAFLALGRYFKSIWDQMRKVVWPTRKELLISVIVVFVFLVITVALVFGVDTGASELVRVIFQNPNPEPGMGLMP